MDIFWKVLAGLLTGLIIIFYPEEFSSWRIKRVWVVERATGQVVSQDSDFIPWTNFTNGFVRSGGLFFLDQTGRTVYQSRLSAEEYTGFADHGLRHVRYKKLGHSIQVYDGGDLLLKYPTDSWPVLSGNGESLLMAAGDMEGVSVISLTNTSLKQEFSMGTPLIDLLPGKDEFFAGFLEGYFLRISYSSSPELYHADDSGIRIIKKIARSETSGMTALLSGLHPEKIHVLSDHSSRVRKILTGGSTRTAVSMEFSPHGHELILQSSDGFQVFRTSTGRELCHFSLNGLGTWSALTAGFLSRDLYYLTGSFNSSAIFIIADKHGRVLWKELLPGEWVRPVWTEGSLILLESSSHIFLLQVNGHG